MKSASLHLIAYKSSPAQCWMVKHLNDPATVATMGTADVPSAFTLQAPAEDVIKELQWLNPHHTIEALETTGCYWKLSEVAELHQHTLFGLLARQFLQSLASNRVGVNLRGLFATSTPEQQELLIETLRRHAQNPDERELQQCARWMESLEP